MESIVFNKIVCGPDQRSDIFGFEEAEAVVRYIHTGEADSAVRNVLGARGLALHSSIKMVFLSHKTGDSVADQVARHILNRHGMWVYMAEWDRAIQNHSPNALPEYIMRTINVSRALLVQVIPQISSSMWIGYEVGGAHAFNKPLAKTMFTPVSNLPAVVDALHSLVNWPALDAWLQHV